MIATLAQKFVGMFISKVDAGACIPSECCAHKRRNNCSGACVVYYGSCTKKHY